MQSVVVRALILTALLVSVAHAQRLEIPRRHDKPPGPPLSPQEAMQKMVVPEGFSVELVAAEPDVMNPVSMCIDEKGRFWITESFEYPRRSAGPGRDRVKVLEDTDGDGKVDKTTVFAEGLNIPSGINVGHGGVWVANSPDILFMQDTDGDLKADKIETVVTGFGRTDTHELPNSLTWGPDGWLYGLNGVFNHSHVKYAEGNPNYDPQHPGWKFTCALFRIHPRTREFQIFAEGTSNPWGVAINEDGEFFLSACVIDHLWHLTETGYYIRQGGPYPPYTWPMRSIVDHKHQKAAYCGITWFDSDAYPELYRNTLFMGNIHGGCVNADVVERNGSTYKGKAHPGFPAPEGAFEHDTVRKLTVDGKDYLADFLTANDAWFMPVVQKVGPDGCLYVLDWYDRYHCYQDANADPEGIERERGRLYRIVYKGHKNEKAEDLASKSDGELIDLLGSPNIYHRNTAQRLLQERSNAETMKTLSGMVLKDEPLDTQRRHALWTLIGCEWDTTPSDQRAESLSLALWKHDDAFANAWATRLQTSQRMKLFTYSDPDELQVCENAISEMESDDLRAQAQAVIFATRLIQQQEPPVNFTDAIMTVLESVDEDPHLAHLIWNHWLAELERNPKRGSEILEAVTQRQQLSERQLELVTRLSERILNDRSTPDTTFFKSIQLLVKGLPAKDKVEQSNARDRTMSWITDSILNGTISKDRYEGVRKAISEAAQLSTGGFGIVSTSEWKFIDAAIGPPVSQEGLVRVAMAPYRRPEVPKHLSPRAVASLAFAQSPLALKVARQHMLAQSNSDSTRKQVVEALGRYQNVDGAELLVEVYEDLPDSVQPAVIELLTQKANWSSVLLDAVAAESIAKSALNLNQLRRVASFKDEALQAKFTEQFGTIREGRSPNREQVIERMQKLLASQPGDPHQGIAVFKKVCGQCHKMYGEGAEVGPDITRNGRNNWKQLLQNVFDPSAVIGPGYQARQLATTDGRILTGLPVEESEERVVLKIQGGKIETIPRAQIEAYKVSEISMMPEDLEKQLSPQELADLFAYLALDKLPSDPEAKILPGAPEQNAR